MTPHGRNDNSLWLARERRGAYEPLGGDVVVDVAVVGGGIVGATAAMLLAVAGKTVALLEGSRLCSGSTGNSTAKATVHQGTNFASSIDVLGVEGARKLVDGDRAALDVLRTWTAELGIPDAAIEVWHWAYTSEERGRGTLDEERAAATRLGVETRWARPDELRFGTAALGTPSQLLIEPARIVDAFAACAASHGALVHEGTRVVDVDKDDEGITLRAGSGATVRASDVVLATQVPIVDRTMVFAGCTYRRSHAVALAADAETYDRTPDMYTGIDAGSLSVRPALDEDGTPLLVVAGRGHSLEEDEDGTHVAQLVEQGRAFTGGGAPRRAWLAHDAFPTDGRPFVGSSRFSEHVFVATGFGGWGLARGVAAALAISDHVLRAPAPGRGPTRWEGPMDATRLGSYLRPSALKEGAKTVVAFLWDRVTAEDSGRVRQLEPGEGAVVRVDGQSVAVARDASGSLHAVGAACTHQGCIVHHDVERSCWQCPCHGSRFDLQGRVLQGPATRPLPLVEIAPEAHPATAPSGGPVPAPAG